MDKESLDEAAKSARSNFWEENIREEGASLIFVNQRCQTSEPNGREKDENGPGEEEKATVLDNLAVCPGCNADFQSWLILKLIPKCLETIKARSGERFMALRRPDHDARQPGPENLAEQT